MDDSTTISTDRYSPIGAKARIIAMRWQLVTRIAMIPFIAVSNRGIKVEVETADLRADISYLVVSNHQSQWDTFVELSALKFGPAKRLLPFRAMTHNGVLHGGLLTNYLLGMGCFPSKPHELLPSGVELATQLLADGQTVFICPEGRRTLPGATPPHRGVTLLANLPNVMILPAHIQWARPNKWQKTFKLNVGKPFDGSGMSAAEIMDKVYALELP